MTDYFSISHWAYPHFKGLLDWPQESKIRISLSCAPDTQSNLVVNLVLEFLSNAAETNRWVFIELPCVWYYIKNGTLVKCMKSQVKLPRFKPWLCVLLAVYLQMG